MATAASATTTITTPAVSASASYASNTLRTLPRKRRPRAVGEVSITCPSSYVYLNSEIKEGGDYAEDQATKTDPVYQNTCIEELKQKIEAVQQSPPQTKESYARRHQRQRIHLTFVRATIAEVDDETREGVVMSTFVGW